VLPLGLATELLELLNHLVDLGLLKSKESIKLLTSSLELGHLGGPLTLDRNEIPHGLTMSSDGDRLISVDVLRETSAG